MGDTIKLTEENLRNIIKKVMLEADYNYHIGNLKDVSDVKPYGSDNKYQMRGRGTGHFGSGLYFSTYNCNEKDSRVTGNEPQTNPELIQVDKGVYRVDMDLYKNMYRVNSEQQGDALFQTLKEINGLYNVIDDSIKYKETLPSNFSQRYLIVKNNLSVLKLNIPDYRDFIKMCSNHSIDKTNTQSMSTLIMEYNGYNGVNVSGVYKYDNTLHGSVIYDLSKTSTEFKKVDINRNDCELKRSESGDYVVGNIFNFKNKLLRGQNVINMYVDEFNKLPENEQLIAIKRHPHYLRTETLDELQSNIKNAYFKTLGYKLKNGILKAPKKYDIGDLIDNNLLNLIYDPSIVFEDGNKTLLLVALENIHYLNSSQESKLLNNINRPLQSDEQEELDWINT